MSFINEVLRSADRARYEERAPARTTVHVRMSEYLRERMIRELEERLPRLLYARPPNLTERDLIEFFSVHDVEIEFGPRRLTVDLTAPPFEGARYTPTDEPPTEVPA